MDSAKEVSMFIVTDRVKENKETGFVPLYRSIKEHWIWKDSRVKTKFEAWLDLLLLASHDDQKEPVGYDLIIVKKGQVLTSQLILSKAWSWDRSAVRGFLSLLQKDNMILVKPTNKFTIITICNYEAYKNKRPTKQHQLNSTSTTTQHIQPLEPLEPLKPLVEIGASHPTNPSFKKWTDKEFVDDIARFKDQYERDMLNSFYKYWSEKDERGKMHFQLKTTWETGKRLATWYSKQQNFKK